MEDALMRTVFGVALWVAAGLWICFILFRAIDRTLGGEE